MGRGEGSQAATGEGVASLRVRAVLVGEVGRDVWESRVQGAGESRAEALPLSLEISGVAQTGGI